MLNRLANFQGFRLDSKRTGEGGKFVHNFFCSKIDFLFSSLQKRNWIVSCSRVRVDLIELIKKIF